MVEVIIFGMLFALIGTFVIVFVYNKFFTQTDLPKTKDYTYIAFSNKLVISNIKTLVKMNIYKSVEQFFMHAFAILYSFCTIYFNHKDQFDSPIDCVQKSQELLVDYLDSQTTKEKQE